jgi:translation initiation factor IF-2
MVAGSAVAPLRIMEDFLGKNVKEAQFSSPLMVVGFSETPEVGALFTTVPDKKSATLKASEHVVKEAAVSEGAVAHAENHFVLPVIVKADVVGSIDAIKHELRKLEDDRTSIQVISAGVGTVAESDVKTAICDKNTVVIGFNVGTDVPARDLAERHEVEVVSFSIIYDLADWLPGAIEKRRPKVRGEKILGTAQVLKCFSFAHKTQTIGCRVTTGVLSVHDQIRIFHGDEERGRGRVKTLKSGMSDVSKITEGNDCGAQIEVELDAEPVYNDKIVAFTVTEE